MVAVMELKPFGEACVSSKHSTELGIISQLALRVWWERVRLEVDRETSLVVVHGVCSEFGKCHLIAFFIWSESLSIQHQLSDSRLNSSNCLSVAAVIAITYGHLLCCGIFYYCTWVHALFKHHLDTVNTLTENQAVNKNKIQHSFSYSRTVTCSTQAYKFITLHSYHKNATSDTPQKFQQLVCEGFLFAFSDHFSIALQQIVSCSQISLHVETHSAHAHSAHVPCDW